MELMMFTTVLGVIAGISIGCVGIGGVMIVPALHYLAGVPIPQAVAAAMMGYLLTGAVGTAIYAHAGSIRWSMAGWLCAAAMPAALIGSWLNNTVPSVALEIAIVLLTVGSGLQALLGGANEGRRFSELRPPSLLILGAAAGALSSMTGTGGPLILVPTMIWLNVPMLTAVGLAQAVQLPIAALATVGNYAFGNPDLRMGVMLALSLAVGSAIGAKLAHRVPRDVLRQIVAAVLLLVGASVLFRIVSAWLMEGAAG